MNTLMNQQQFTFQQFFQFFGQADGVVLVNKVGTDTM